MRTLLALSSAAVVFTLACAFFTVETTEYGLVLRFGQVVRVIAEPGLYVTAPYDQVVRLNKRIFFSRPQQAEYLTTDKKNVLVDSLATWRIADPERFLATLATAAAAEQGLSDVVVAEIGSVLGRYPASVLIATEPTESRYFAIMAEIGRRVAEFARPAYGIDVLSVDLRRLSLPEQNRDHVFDRMQAERAKIAKENRSAGELEAKKIIAEADHEQSRIEAEAAGRAERIRAQADAEAARTYAAAFGQDPMFYQFLRSLRAYDKILDDKTTLFVPADADVLRILRFDPKRAPPEPSSPAPARQGIVASPPPPSDEVPAGAELRLKKKPQEGDR